MAASFVVDDDAPRAAAPPPFGVQTTAVRLSEHLVPAHVTIGLYDFSVSHTRRAQCVSYFQTRGHKMSEPPAAS
jgi:hypothetical protein